MHLHLSQITMVTRERERGNYWFWNHLYLHTCPLSFCKVTCLNQGYFPHYTWNTFNWPSVNHTGNVGGNIRHMEAPSANEMAVWHNGGNMQKLLCVDNCVQFSYALWWLIFIYDEQQKCGFCSQPYWERLAIQIIHSVSSFWFCFGSAFQLVPFFVFHIRCLIG